jgi:hypothetical protein
MKTRLFVLILCLAAIAVIPATCSVDPETRLERALERYGDNDSGSLRELEQACIRYASLESLDGNDLQSNGTLLYRIKGSRAEIYYPASLTLNLIGGEDIIQVAADNNHAAITDGLRIALFTGSGSHIQDETLGDKKSPIRSLAIDDGSVLYYRNSKVYRYDIAVKTSSELAKESFPSPYTSYYNTLFAENGALLGVCAGIAGSYSLSIVNVKTGAIVVKNLGMSSSRFFMGEKALYYITGSSGKWDLYRFDLSTKGKKPITGFSDLVDIVPAAGGYVCETSAGLFTALYGSERKRIPFAYKLAGLYKGRVLMHYRGTYYFIDMKRLHEGLARIAERAPGLMTATGK